MKTVILHGEPAKLFGREHFFEIRSPLEAIRALCATVKGFRKYLYKESQTKFKVFAGGRNVSEELAIPCSNKEIIHIAPIIQGASAAGRIIVGAALIALAVSSGGAAFLAGIGTGIPAAVGSFGMSLVFGGVVELLTRNNKTEAPNEKEANKPSYNFNGPVNTLAQGHPVPLAYGRVMVGSSVISAGLRSQ